MTNIGYRRVIPWDVFPAKHADLLGNVKLNEKIVYHSSCIVTEHSTEAP